MSNTTRKNLQLGPNRNIEHTRSLIIYENHQRAAVLDKAYNLNDLFVFCFSRNPYILCVSWYQFHKNVKRSMYTSLSFESWINEGMPHHFVVQNETNYLAENITPLLQYNFVEHYKIDFIGKMENFDCDMALLIDKLNINCRQKGLRHEFHFTRKRANLTNYNRDYKNHYNEKTQNAVYSLLRKDFDYFGYDKNDLP